MRCQLKWYIKYMLPRDFFYVFLAADALFILTVISVWIKEKPEWLKNILFGGMSLVALSLTTYLVYTTVHKNVTSVTGGPVHYHADFRVFACGEEVELVDPEGLSNKVGTSLFHEHNDSRIHVEGAVGDLDDITLAKFFEVTGGELTNQYLKILTNDPEGMVKTYYDYQGKQGFLQVFVYRTEGESITQTKIDNPTQYVLSPYSQVPPGDCIIIEFDSVKEKTDKICDSYGVKVQTGELHVH